MKKISVFDTTLRDGAQAEGISFSVSDKLKIVDILVKLGIDYIEAGNPGSNPKDLEFFNELKSINLGRTKIVAFGSTKRKNIKVEEDDNVVALLGANTPVISIFGKTWDFHVDRVLHCSLEENLNMIYDTIAFFKEKGKETIFDAEHFFDGYKENPLYAIKALKAAVSAGADYIVLCETNGGCLPLEVFEITKKVKKELKNVKLGIHCHNDSDTAVANSIIAVQAGVNQVQGTFLGIGERCGNASLASIISNLQIKLGYGCVKKQELENLTTYAYALAEISNLTVDKKTPFIGMSAFAHKGGMHIDGVSKFASTYEHIKPKSVGNSRRFLMSEVGGRSLILKKIQRIDPSLKKESKKTKQIIDLLKEKEHQGYQYEGAEASFELLILKKLGVFVPSFKLEHFKVFGGEPSKLEYNSSAIIKITSNGQTEFAASEGNGQVNALNKALKKALEVFYPKLIDVHLIDYKVRVLDPESGTRAKTRVLISSTDGKKVWNTVGVSRDLIEASWIALVDSLEYKLLKR